MLVLVLLPYICLMWRKLFWETLKGLPLERWPKWGKKKCCHLQFATLSQPKPRMCLFTLVIRKKCTQLKKKLHIHLFYKRISMDCNVYIHDEVQDLFSRSLKEKPCKRNHKIPTIIRQKLQFFPQVLWVINKKNPTFSLKFFVLSNWK